MMCKVASAVTGREVNLHSKENRCEACGATFRTKSELMAHAKNHRM